MNKKALLILSTVLVLTLIPIACSQETDSEVHTLQVTTEYRETGVRGILVTIRYVDKWGLEHVESEATGEDVPVPIATFNLGGYVGPVTITTEETEEYKSATKTVSVPETTKAFIQLERKSPLERFAPWLLLLGVPAVVVIYWVAKKRKKKH